MESISDYANSSNEITKEILYEDNSQVSDNCKRLRILHFNDVYNIEGDRQEPMAGVARFYTALKMIEKDAPYITLFSGDVFSPSSYFGVDTLIDLIGETNFPWLISNAFDAETNEPLAMANVKHVIYHNGLKIGLIGLIEQEWIETLSTIDFDDVIYESFVDVGRKLAIELKQVDKVDYVIALTHMRVPNDILLGEEAPEIDLILGGHDHDYFCELINGRWVVKSGTDFRHLSLIEVEFDKSQKKSSVKKIEKFTIDSKVKEDEEMKKMVDQFLDLGDQGLDELIGEINVDLDGRFNVVRKMESNLGNLVCDAIMEGINADCAIINSGTLRSDSITPAGNFTVGHLKKIIPFPDPIVLLSVDGKTLYKALENGVSQYPKLEGRFPQVSGISFAFDPKKRPGERIDPRLVKIQDEYLDFDEEYKLATKLYLKDGKDGYNMLTDCAVLVDEEEGPLLFTLIENHFKSVHTIKQLSMVNQEQSVRRRSSIVPIAKRNSIIKECLHEESILPNGGSDEEGSAKVGHHQSDFFNRRVSRLTSTESRKLSLSKSLNIPSDVINNIKKTEVYKRQILALEEKSLKMSPRVEGRICCIKNEQYVDFEKPPDLKHQYLSNKINKNSDLTPNRNLKLVSI